jgi:hypothetical protein
LIEVNIYHPHPHHHPIPHPPHLPHRHPPPHLPISLLTYANPIFLIIALPLSQLDSLETNQSLP